MRLRVLVTVVISGELRKENAVFPWKPNKAKHNWLREHAAAN